MKTLKTFFGILVLGALLTTVSCKDAKKVDATTKTEQSEKQGKEYTSAYICPMHCEGSGSSKAGTCPTCNMDYVINNDYKKEIDTHEEQSHEGHKH